MASSQSKTLLILPHYPLLLIVVLSCFFPIQTLSFTSFSVATEEARALAKWKDSLFGGSPSSLSSWSLPPVLGRTSNTSWVGVSCNGVGRVVGLNISNLGLQGTLEHFPFLTLTHLVKLDLDNNALLGSIPLEIGNLKRLQSLILSSNNFNGSIPSSIAKLTNLTILRLENNQLSGTIPISFRHLINLNYLILYNNSLSGPLHTEITELPLIRLSIARNNFFGNLPPSLCRNGILEQLCACSNKFTGPIPTSLKNCPNLIRLRLENNQLSGPISDAFGFHPKLDYIDLNYNMFYGSLPENWNSFKNLTSLKISNNNITSRIPPGLGSLVSLGVLDISSNHLIGDIPKELGELTSLVDLNLSSNRLYGALPVQIGSLSGLEKLDLSSNSLSGHVPKEISNCSKLIWLNLSKNKFSGKIPSQLGNMGSLQPLLDLSQNLFSGEIPSEMSSLKMLLVLNLSHNMLNGSIPPSFEIMDSLTSIDVSYNTLEGLVPGNKAFQDASPQAFRNNKGLCGPIKALQPCDSSKIRNDGTKAREKTLKIVLLSLVGLSSLLLALFGICFAFSSKKRISMEEINVNTDDDVFSVFNIDGRVFYEDIIEATEGFDDKHCIGVGGYGSVYKALLPTSQVVAVKKINTIDDSDVVYVNSFLTEVRTLTELRHRNIVKLYGFCSHIRHTFLVYEYMDRGSLDKLLKNCEEACSLDWMKRLDILKSVANALAHMHHGCSPPLVHRDISSKNILLNKEYDACVADFGIARALKPNSSNWTTPAGTYGYLAPEIAYIMKLNEKCDVYSFGVLTFEVIMGKHPGECIPSLTSYTSKEYNVLLQDILDKRILPPSSEIFKEFVLITKLALQCLNASPECRPTMEFVSRELSKSRVLLVK